jgi:ElaB/YqjD/DUF883 family membrane-anchored ribosome-binding protein
MSVETQTREPQMGLTFEKVWAAMMESREDFDRRLKETERLMRESSEKAEKEMRELRESQQKTARAVEETTRVVKETTRVVKETSRSVGGLQNSFGELAEHLVAPSIEEKFNALGYHFEGSFKNPRIRNEQGQTVAEIDILLENSDYSVAVEVKSKPKMDDIADFERRLEILRKYKDKNHDIRRIRGAIAGAVFQDDVKSAVLKAGFYVIEQTGDTVKISVPEGFKPKEW